MINAALAYPSLYGDYLYAASPSSYDRLGLSPQAVSVPGTANFPNDRVGAETPGFASAYNYGYNDEGSYYVDAAHGGLSSGPIKGSVTADLSGTLVGYFKMYWSGPGPAPASADFLVSTWLYAQASVSYAGSQMPSGLSASATASDGAFNETASASAGSGASSDGVPQVQGYHLVRAAVDPNTHIAEVYVSGTAHWTLSNMVPYASYGSTTAVGGSLVRAGARSDNRDVIIASNFSTPSSPTYYREPIHHSLVANVRQPDGSMTDDITTPPLNAGGLGAPAGTSATYTAVLGGTWGANSTYKWNCSLTSPTAFSSLPISGTFNSSSPLGNGTQTIPNFSGTYYNPPASDRKSDLVTLTITDGSDGASAANTYTVRFHHPHADPINFRCVDANTVGDGVLHYTYTWDSSTGIRSDLVDCTIMEKVDYSNNASGTEVTDSTGKVIAYRLPPPFFGTYRNPEIYGGTLGTDDDLYDDHLIPAIVRPYQYGSYNSTQYYIYTDESSDPTNANDYKFLRGPIDIVRSVSSLDSRNWIYDIIKYDAPDGGSKSYGEAKLTLSP